MKSILITGCNRGLGLGLIKAILDIPKPPEFIFATCRDVSKAVELNRIAEEHKNVHVMQIDLREFKSYDKLVQDVVCVLEDKGLNVLFNNAGIAPKSTRITGTREKDLTDTFLTNTVVPVMLSKAFLPLLKKASEKHSSQPLGVNRAAIVNMSSKLGSIAANNRGAMYGYRASKAALNACTKSLAIDLKTDKILCVSLHPGYVRTDMGGPKAPLDIQSSCKAMIATIQKFSECENGGFYQYDGEKLEW